RPGDRGADQRGALELELVLVRSSGRGGGRRVAAGIGDGGDRGGGAGQVARVGPRDALAVDDVHPVAIGAGGDVARLVGGGDQAADLVGVLAVQRDHGDGVGAGVDGVERPAVRREGHGERGGAGEADASLMAVEVVVAVVFAVVVAVVIARPGQNAGG